MGVAGHQHIVHSTHLRASSSLGCLATANAVRSTQTASSQPQQQFLTNGGMLAHHIDGKFLKVLTYMHTLWKITSERGQPLLKHKKASLPIKRFHCNRINVYHYFAKICPSQTPHLTLSSIRIGPLCETIISTWKLCNYITS